MSLSLIGENRHNFRVEAVFLDGERCGDTKCLENRVSCQFEGCIDTKCLENRVSCQFEASPDKNLSNKDHSRRPSLQKKSCTKKFFINQLKLKSFSWYTVSCAI